jgi:hypothetical protein
MLGFLILLTLFLGGFIFLLTSGDIKEISENWPKYRCSPTIMPFASLYGHDAAENFQFCIKNILQGKADELLGPFGSVIATFLGTLSTLIQSANSMRLQMATLVGGLSSITQEFQNRIVQLMFRVQLTAGRIKFLMYRLFATFYSVIYMGMSGITAVSNLGDSFLFKFLDTFCFDGNTLVDLEEKGLTPISKVQIGDRFSKTGGKVTAVFRFACDGQPMVTINDILVSTNHYVQGSDGKWIQSKDHPLAIPTSPWVGGVENPLWCVNTSDHKIPIDDYIFLDYDETEEGDQETMDFTENRVNSFVKRSKRSKSTKVEIEEYSPTVSSTASLKMKEGHFKKVTDIQLGDELANGRVAGIIQKEITRYCNLDTESVGEATLIWCPQKQEWRRAAEDYAVHTLQEPTPFYSFVVVSTAILELQSGHKIRDYVEVHSPDSEAAYTKAIPAIPFH